MLAGSPFVGEGYRKVWARLRLAGVRTSKGRLLRLMREAGLLAPTRVGRRRGPRNHDGTITTERPDEMWGTDATACLTTSEGNATVFVAVDHCTQECVGIHAARPGTRFEALEPLRQGLRAHYGSYGAGVAAGLSLRHDHGSQYLSDHSRTSCASSASARARRSWPPEGNGCAERFIRTLKEQLLWVETFQTVEQLRLALLAFKDRYNQAWLVERHGPPHPGRRPRGALVEHRSGRMITASEVSKKPGAVHAKLLRTPSRSRSTRRICPPIDEVGSAWLATLARSSRRSVRAASSRLQTTPSTSPRRSAATPTSTGRSSVGATPRPSPASG